MGCCHFQSAPNVEEERQPIRDPSKREFRQQLSDYEEAKEAHRREETERLKQRALAAGAKFNFDSLLVAKGEEGPEKKKKKLRRHPENVPSNYRKIKEVGKGAFGTVWQAEDLVGKRVVAIKTIATKSLVLDSGAKERLGREVAIMKALKHPNLVNLHALIRDDATDELWMIVDFVDGCDLLKRLEGGPLSENSARDYFQQMVIGLHYVHSQGVAHRDLKPDNILLTKGGTVKITDFGLSNFQATDAGGAVPHGLSLKTCCGTPYYVAPEVIISSQNKGYNGFTSDLWSLGVILYTMLVGDVPFQAADLRGVLQQITRGVFEFPRSCKASESAKACVRSLLVREDKRATIAQLVTDPWVLKNFDQARMQAEHLDVDPTDPDLMATFKELTESIRES
ncbi:CBL-interacting serine/threonine-protein kinase 5 [Diplonema papillatum]|nr:CBL-interacting serine/threonine-protein kinase 5 [Diplonema papillatum]|eukprot:gene10565-16245_t